MSVRKKHKVPGEAHTFVVDGAEHLFIEWHMPSGEVLKIAVDAGRKGVDGREFFSVGGTFNRSTEVSFTQHMPQEFSVIGRLPKA